jgi:hypothetical protein
MAIQPRRWQGVARVAASALFMLLSVQVYAQNPAVTINVDAGANQRPISPQIYGVAFAKGAQLGDLNFTLNRSGGNSATRYNWQTDSHNTAQDYFYESISECFGSNPPVACGVPGQGNDLFVQATQSAGAQPLLTIPMIDWIAKAGVNHPFLCSFPATLYPNQQAFDPYDTNCGNGIDKSGNNITGNDPNLANVTNSVSTQNAWVLHLIGKWGMAANGGVRYYILDNEHSIWFSTHRDVHPVGPHMDEIESKMVAFGAMVRTNDPGAILLGPEEYGWTGYFFSGYDQQYGAIHGYNYLPDRATHNNMDYMPWLLQALYQDEVNTGVRKLDVFSLHYYPSGDLAGHYEYGNDVSTATQLLRNVSTRSLWDPNYKDASWIQDYVMLIPRMKNWVATYYPGLMVGITEYNWGAEDHINGATTQADILGIFGREGLDIGTRWTTPDATTPTYLAMKMYRNYDGNKSTFGDTSVMASAPNPDDVSSFASLRSSDGALTVMLISKVLTGTTPVTVSLANFQAQGTAQVWQLTSANAIMPLSDITLAGSNLTITLPAQSITLLVIPQPQDFSLNIANPVISVYPNLAATFSGTLTARGGYSAPVSVTCGAGKPTNCAGTAATPGVNGQPFTLTASDSRIQDFSFNVVATGSDPAATTHQQPVTLHVVDFAVSAPSPASVSTPTNSVSQPVAFQLQPLGAFNNLVTLSCMNLPLNATCSFMPAGTIALSGAAVTVTVQIVAAANTPVGSYPTVAIVATSTVNQVVGSYSQTLPLTINTSSGTTDLAIKGLTLSRNPVTVGGKATLTATLTNNGATATNVNFSLTFSAAPISIATSAPNCTVQQVSVSCALGTLSDGASMPVPVTVTVPFVRSLTATATISSVDVSDSNPANNSVGTTVQVRLRPFAR